AYSPGNKVVRLRVWLSAGGISPATRSFFDSMTQLDVQRFDRVVLPHLDDAYTLARYLLRDEHDAQDVVQEAVLRALRYFDGYSGGDARAWLLAIVRNCAMTWHRRRQSEGQTLPFGEPAVALVVDPLESDARAIER